MRLISGSASLLICQRAQLRLSDHHVPDLAQMDRLVVQSLPRVPLPWRSPWATPLQVTACWPAAPSMDDTLQPRGRQPGSGACSRHRAVSAPPCQEQGQCVVQEQPAWLGLEQHLALAERLQAQQLRLQQQRAEQEAWATAACAVLARHAREDGARHHSPLQAGMPPAARAFTPPPLAPSCSDATGHPAQRPAIPSMHASDLQEAQGPPAQALQVLPEAQQAARQAQPAWPAQQVRHAPQTWQAQQAAQLLELQQVIAGLQREIAGLQAAGRQRQALLAAAEAEKQRRWEQKRQRWEERARKEELELQLLQQAAALAAAAEPERHQPRRQLQQHPAAAGAPHLAAQLHAPQDAAIPWAEHPALRVHGWEACHEWPPRRQALTPATATEPEGRQLLGQGRLAGVGGALPQRTERAAPGAAPSSSAGAPGRAPRTVRLSAPVRPQAPLPQQPPTWGRGELLPAARAPQQPPPPQVGA